MKMLMQQLDSCFLGTEKIYVANIKDQIDTYIASYANSLETDPFSTISTAIADDFVYGTTTNEVIERKILQKKI